jgi:hypothetical protein
MNQAPDGAGSFDEPAPYERRALARILRTVQSGCVTLHRDGTFEHNTQPVTSTTALFLRRARACGFVMGQPVGSDHCVLHVRPEGDAWLAAQERGQCRIGAGFGCVTAHDRLSTKGVAVLEYGPGNHSAFPGLRGDGVQDVVCVLDVGDLVVIAAPPGGCALTGSTLLTFGRLCLQMARSRADVDSRL